MGRSHTPSARAAATDVRLPNADAASDADARELLNRAHLAREMLRGSYDGPRYATVEPGGSGSSYTVTIGPVRFVTAEGAGTLGARLLVDADGATLGRTDFTGPPAAFTTGVWRYVYAGDDGAGAIAWSQEVLAPVPDPPWYPGGRAKLFCIALRTDDSGNPLPASRVGNKTTYTRWYADATITNTNTGSGTTLVSLATRVPGNARRAVIHVSAIANTPGISEAADTSDFVAVSADRFYEVDLDASQRFRLHGTDASITYRIVSWED